MNAVENGRLGVASRAVGLSQACVDVATSYARERVVFKQPIGKFQMVQEMLSNMICGTEGARAPHLPARVPQGPGPARQGRGLDGEDDRLRRRLQSATDAFQIHGAYGVSDEYPVARYLRDAKVFQIVEGNNQLHKALVASAALGLDR